ncbi:MAG: hypothetical protein MPJ78_11005 [Hyphomicrobiaceae bacterium]|nr:hypothetical protein [Hyphomicrobiaceae bacterium]
MKRSFGLFAFFVLMVGGIVATHALTSESMPDGLTCQPDRLAAFGWTDQRLAMAELAAITKWQTEVEEKSPGSGNWHLAQRRSMKCRAFKNSSHFQCVVSAKPCKFEGKLAKGGEGASGHRDGTRGQLAGSPNARSK